MAQQCPHAPHFPSSQSHHPTTKEQAQGATRFCVGQMPPIQRAPRSDLAASKWRDARLLARISFANVGLPLASIALAD